MRKINESKIASALIYGIIFLLMMLCNCMTPYLVDDFHYMLSFQTDERITSIWQIIPSMWAHAHSMNGRLVAHSLAQLSLMGPKWIFNIVNSLVYALQVWLICRLSRGAKRNNYISVGVFCALWLYTKAFGQVNLWVDGSCNYLWGIVFALIFLLPYADSFLHDRQLSGIKRWLFPVFAFAAGAYSESTSFAAVGMAFLLLLLEVVVQRKKLDLYKFITLFIAGCGYLSIYLAPAQWANKSVELTGAILLDNFSRSIEVYGSFSVLLGIFAVLVLLNLISNTDRNRIWLAAVLLAGSVFANLIMVAAVEYPERSSLPVCVFIVSAVAVLAGNLSGQYKVLCAAIVAYGLVITAFPLYTGVMDIYQCHRKQVDNETHIAACIEQGNLDVTIPHVYGSTQYSGFYGMRYLTADPEEWPNWQMALYYGLNSIRTP